MSTDNQILKKEDGIKTLLSSENVKKKFSEMLGKRTGSFLITLTSIVQNNELLSKANQHSILYAAANAASMDLPINPNLGLAYIIPYNKKNKNGTYEQFAQFQMGYKGFIQLAMRSGQFKTIGASPIYNGQLVAENPLTSEYIFDFKVKKAGNPIGYAAFFKLLNGFEKTLYMTSEEMGEHGAKYSKTFGNNGGLWKKDPIAMGLKTVLKLLLSKFAPMSVDKMEQAISTDQAVLNDWDSKEVEYVDHDEVVLSLEEVEKAKEDKNIKEHIENATSIEKLKQVREALSTDEQKDLYDIKHSQLTQSQTQTVTHAS